MCSVYLSLCTTGTSAVSPLSWLLSEYLDNSESARHCKSRAAIFNSRVRRLTHLLVHVDTSRIDTEELKPPVKSSELPVPHQPPSSSTLYSLNDFWTLHYKHFLSLTQYYVPLSLVIQRLSKAFYCLSKGVCMSLDS